MRIRPKTVFTSCLILLGLLLAAGILFTRSFFITGVILPRVSEATGVDIEAVNIGLSFRGMVVEDLSVSGVAPKDSFSAERIDAVFSWSDMLKGRWVFQTVNVVNPVLSVHTVRGPSTPEEDPPDATPQEPLPLDLKHLTIENGTIHLLHPEQNITFEQLNLDLSNLAPGKDSSIILSSGISFNPTAEEAPPQHGTATLEATLSLSPSLIPTHLRGGLQLHVEALSEDLPAFSLRFSPEVSFDPDHNLLRLETLEADATQDKLRVLTLTLEEPALMDLSSPVPTVSDTSLVLKIPEISTKTLPFSSLLPLQSDAFSADLHLTIKDNGATFEGSAHLTANELSGTLGSLPLEASTGSLHTEIAGTREQISVSKLVAELRQQQRSLFSLEATGTVSPVTGAAELTLEQLKADSTLSLIARPEPVPFEGTLSSQGRLVRSETGLVRVNLSSVVNSRTPVPDLFPVRLSLVGEADSTAITLTTGRLQWAQSAEYDNTLVLRGGVDFQPDQAPGLEIIAEANAIDLTPWGDFLKSLAEDKGSADAPEAVSVEVTLPDLPIHASTFTLDLGRVKINELIVEAVDVNLALAPRSLVLHPASFKLDGATLSTSSSLVWTDDPAVFETSLMIEPIEIQPLFDALLPDAPGAVKGTFSIDWNLSGSGLTSAELLKTLQGSLDLSLVDGQVRLFSPVPGSPEGLLQTQALLEKVIRTLATALAVPPEQLLDPPIEHITLKASIGNEVLELTTFLAENPEFRLVSTGRLPFNADQFTETEVSTLPVSLGVSTNIAQRVRIYREDRLVDNKIMLPPLMDITGTLAEPKIDVRKRVIGGLVITGVTDRNKTGNEKVDTALSILGGLLSGEGPPPTPTPTPAPE